MSLSAITQPNQYMAAYSAVPLKLFSSDYTSQQFYKYIVNVTWNKVTISQDVSINIGDNIYTKLTSTTPHLFEVGDTVILDDAVNLGNATGYYNVQAVINSTQFAIDLIPTTPFANSGFTVSNVLKWRLSPDLDGYGKIDLSNTLKDFVSQNLTGQSVNYALTYPAPNTKFDYQLFCGSEQLYTFRFQDNLFSGGTVAFYSTGTTISEVPFEVGDTIKITQDLYAWAYVDNYFAGGALGLTGTTNPPFLQGQSVTITGQETFPYYNGLTTVGGTGTNSMYVDKFWQGNTPVEGGYVYGVPRPEYNTVATITSITTHPTYGVVINTDVPFSLSSPPIPGVIQFADGRITENPVEIKLTSASVFNAHIDRDQYTMNAYDRYVVQLRSATGNSISSIFGTGINYRVEPNTIGFLLTHTYRDTYVDGLYYQFRSKNNTILGNIIIPKSSSGLTDFYAPMGLQQIGNTSYSALTGGAFSAYSGNVDTYSVWAYDAVAPSTITTRTLPINFKINEDCSMYEVYHLMWKDKLGSFISYPFIYMSRDNIEVERQTYYKQEGSWDNNTFQYYDYGDGEKNFYLQSRKSYILNSGWLYQFEVELMEDLMTSPSVYIQTPDNRLFQCHITQNEVELFKQINEQLFSYTFNVRVSNNEYRF